MPADGTVLVQAFDDWNENATWDTGEPGVAGLAFAYAGQDPGNSGVTGTLTTTTAGTATATLTIGAYGYNVTAPAGYSLMVPYGLSSQFTLTTGQTTTIGFPLIPIGTGTTATDADSPMVISQVYGSGGGTGSTYNRDFIELFNRGTASVDLSGWSIQYADTRSGSWQVIPLSGTLAAGRYYLIGGATGGTGAALPTVDASSTVNLATGAGKVVLDNSTTALSGTTPNGAGLADLVGYGHADWYEGTGRAPGTTGGTAAFRLGHGNYDTNDNLWDSTTATVNPRNTASAVGNRAPAVTPPGIRQTPINTSLTFSTATSSAITIVDPDAGASAVEITVNGSFGTVTLAGTTGLTFTAGDGTADTSMTFTGTLTNIAAALNGLTFAPTTGYRGYGGLTVWANDQGNTGAGGALFDYGVANVVVGGPVVAENEVVDGTEDTAAVIDVRANDAWVAASAPTISIVTNPANGTAAVGTSGAQAGMVVYTPAAEWHGTDTLTYRLTDGQGNTSTATVTIAVAQVNDARIGTSGDPNMYAIEADPLTARFVAPGATVPVTWAATGLPTGLAINATTGEITGRPQYNQAGAQAGTVTATASTGDTDTLALSWNVTDTNRWSLLDDQVATAGDFFYYPEFARDWLGNTLSYQITGLPPGVTFTPNSGFTGTTPVGAAGTYQVHAEATGGGATDVRDFTITLVAPTTNQVAFAVNSTFRRPDDVGFVGKSLPVGLKLFLHSAAGTSASIQVAAADPARVSVSLDPADLVGSSAVTVPMTESGNLSFVYAIPRLPSAADDDIVLVANWLGAPPMFGGPAPVTVGEGKLNGVTVQVGSTGIDKDGTPNTDRLGVITAQSTPKEMLNPASPKYRIPPRAWEQTPFWVRIQGDLGTKELWVRAPWVSTGTIGGQSDANGRVALKMAADAKVAVPDSERIKLVKATFGATNQASLLIRGHLKADNVTPYQTSEGKAGNLWVGVFNKDFPNTGDAKLSDAGAYSHGFSVAAIPVAVQVSFVEPLKGTEVGDPKPGAPNPFILWGMLFESTFLSDSGQSSDLDKVAVAEIVVPADRANPGTGYFKGIKDIVGNFGWAFEPGPGGAAVPMPDFHAIGPQSQNPLGKNTKVYIQEVAAALRKQIVTDGSGEAKRNQYFVFFDYRTGAANAPVIGNLKPETAGIKIKKSGFRIEFVLDAKPEVLPEFPNLKITKSAMAVEGVEAGILTAGSGGTRGVRIAYP